MIYPPYFYKAFDVEEHAKNFIENGEMRFGSLTSYKKIEDPTRQDKTEGFCQLNLPGNASSSENDFDLPDSDERMVSCVCMKYGEIARRVSELWGLSRTGSRIVSAVQHGLHTATRAGKIAHGSPFFFKPDEKEIPIRNRENAASANLRKPEMLPPTEIMAAILAVVRIHFGIKSDEVIAEVSRLFGFKSTSSQLRQTFQVQLEQLIDSGNIVEKNSLLQLPER